MNTKEAGKIIAENLTVRTHENVVKMIKNNFSRRKGGYATKITAGYFKDLLDFRFNNELSRGETALQDITEQVREMLGTAGNVTEWEEIRGKLVDIYCEGYLAGYISAVKDTETFIYGIDDAKEGGIE